MITTDNPASDSATKDLVITRIFDAPREIVFDAWPDPKQVAHWWGPRGFTITIHEMDVRPGGVWRFIMYGPDGVDYDNRIAYVEVVKPERLVYNHGEDEEDDAGQFLAIITFADQGGKTEITMRSLFKTAADRDKVVTEYGAIEGGNQTLDRLGEYLTTM